MKLSINYYKIFGYCLIPINIILLALLELNYFNKLPAYWNSIYIFYALLIINTGFFSLRLKHLKEEEREHDYTVFWAKYLFLLGLVVLAVNQFLKRAIVTDYMSYIIGVIIALGFLTFYASRERVEKEIEDEKISEEENEKKRKNEFEKKFPRINKIWGLRTIIKWMYKEGWWYSGLLIGIVIGGFVIRFIMASSMTLSVDETYTYFSGLGWFRYHNLSTTLSGGYYPRDSIYNLLATIPIHFIQNPVLGLRILNVLIFSVFIFFGYHIFKSFFSKKMSILATAMISINWFLNATVVTSRGYIIAIIASFLVLYLSYKIYSEDKIKKIVIYMVLAIIIFFINFFEGHNIIALHSLILLTIPIFIKLFRMRTRKLIIILFLFVLFLFLGFVYIFYVRPDIFSFILQVFNIDIKGAYIDPILFQGDILSYFTIIGILLIYVSLFLAIFSFKKEDNKNFIFFLSAIFIIFTLFIQVFIFSGKRSYPRYFSDLIIPIIILFVFFISKLLKKGMLNKIISIAFIVLFFSSSFVNIYSIYEEKLNWEILQPLPWQAYLNEIPQNATLLTDFSSIPEIYRPDLKVYTLRGELEDREIVDINYSNLYAPVPLLSREKNKDLFKSYISSEINQDYIIYKNQTYLYFTGSPNVMDLDHLKRILNSSNGGVYLILTHNTYNTNKQRLSPDLYYYILTNSKIIHEDFSLKNAYDNRNFNKKDNSNRIGSLLYLKS